MGQANLTKTQTTKRNEKAASTLSELRTAQANRKQKNKPK